MQEICQPGRHRTRSGWQLRTHCRPRCLRVKPTSKFTIASKHCSEPGELRGVRDGNIKSCYEREEKRGIAVCIFWEEDCEAREKEEKRRSGGSRVPRRGGLPQSAIEADDRKVGLLLVPKLWKLVPYLGAPPQSLCRRVWGFGTKGSPYSQTPPSCEDWDPLFPTAALVYGSITP